MASMFLQYVSKSICRSPVKVYAFLVGWKGWAPPHPSRSECGLRPISKQMQRLGVRCRFSPCSSIYNHVHSFDVIELSSGFLSIPEDDWLRLVDKVQSYKLEPKPELGIQFRAGCDTPASGLEAMGTSDPGKSVNLGHKFLDAGVKRLMIRGHRRERQFLANRCSLENYERAPSVMCDVWGCRSQGV